jgi:hypothetical protein
MYQRDHRKIDKKKDCCLKREEALGLEAKVLVCA